MRPPSPSNTVICAFNAVITATAARVVAAYAATTCAGCPNCATRSASTIPAALTATSRRRARLNTPAISSTLTSAAAAGSGAIASNSSVSALVNPNTAYAANAPGKYSRNPARNRSMCRVRSQIRV